MTATFNRYVDNVPDTTIINPASSLNGVSKDIIGPVTINLPCFTDWINYSEDIEQIIVFEYIPSVY